MTPEQERTFLQQVSLGAYPSQAALKVGVQPSAISMRKKRNPEFARKLQEAEAGAEFGMVAEVRMSKDPRLILEMLARRWPERWARPEIRAQLQVANIDTDELAKAMLAGLSVLAARHAPKDAADVDVTLPEPGAPPDAGDERPPVARS